ncbi:MAG TPA: triose-phosphate isomerase family protein [archaeon]|nr:triose-phosphate isomerase family protein [archaeon]
MSYVIANWKMNKSIEESVEFAKELRKRKPFKNKAVICAPFTFLPGLSKELKNDSEIFLGAQNVFFEDKGAFTGEVSPLMLKPLCSYVILGHSERRKYLNESFEMVKKKINAAVKNDLIPVVCIGEDSKDLSLNEIKKEISERAQQYFSELKLNDGSKLIVCYEPQWAISTSSAGSKEMNLSLLKEILVFFRKKLIEVLKEIGESVPLIFGGSVSRESIEGLFSLSELDGVLVGGASLDLDHFVDLLNFKK